MVRYLDYNAGDDNDNSYIRSEGMFSPTSRISVTARLALIWSYVSLLVCTCQLSMGAKFVATHGAARSKKFAICIYLLAAFSSLASFASFCVRQYKLSGNADAKDTITTILSLLRFIAIVLLCASALAVFIFSLLARKVVRERQATVLLLKMANRLAIISGINTIVFA